MSVGTPVTKQQFDARLGAVIIAIRDGMAAARYLRTWVVDATDVGLTELGYDADEIYLIDAATQDLLKLADVFDGATAVTPAYDFRTYTGKLTGVD